MFDIGMQELLVIAVVALVVLGPQRIPSAARQAGRAFTRIRKAARELNCAVRRTLEEESGDE